MSQGLGGRSWLLQRCDRVFPCRSSDREHSGSVVECLTRDQRAMGSSLTGITALCPGARINLCLVLVQPRKTCPFITETLLMDCKESNQKNKQKIQQLGFDSPTSRLGQVKIFLLYDNAALCGAPICRRV